MPFRVQLSPVFVGVRDSERGAFCYRVRITGVSKEISVGRMTRALDYAYGKAVNGFPGMDSAEELAESYLKTSSDKKTAARSLARWQMAKAGTSGFLTGLPGGLVLLATVPANIASVLYVQIRMIAAIAHMGGYDIKDDRVRTLVFVCMTGSAGADIVKDAGIKMGTKITEAALKRMSAETIKAINQKVGFRLVTKFGSTGIVNLGKMIPVLGGVIGGAFDVTTTKTISHIAIKRFVT